jgi:hypothetical protein
MGALIFASVDCAELVVSAFCDSFAGMQPKTCMATSAKKNSFECAFFIFVSRWVGGFKK